METNTPITEPGDAMGAASAEPEPKRLSEEISDIFAYHEEDATVRTLLDRISHRSFGMILAILALPSALPLPAPGYAVPFGIVLALLAVQIIRGQDRPWFPERVLNRRIGAKAKGREKRRRLVQWMIWFVAQAERVLKPRLQFLYANPVFVRGSGAVVLICALSMCTPVPLTNTLPALGVFLIGMGFLEEDGFFGITGIATAIAGVILALTVIVLVVLLGHAAVDLVKDVIRDFIPGR